MHVIVCTCLHMYEQNHICMSMCVRKGMHICVLAQILAVCRHGKLFESVWACEQVHLNAAQGANLRESRALVLWLQPYFSAPPSPWLHTPCRSQQSVVLKHRGCFRSPSICACCLQCPLLPFCLVKLLIIFQVKVSHLLVPSDCLLPRGLPCLRTFRCLLLLYRPRSWRAGSVSHSFLDPRDGTGCSMQRDGWMDGGMDGCVEG